MEIDGMRASMSGMLAGMARLDAAAKDIAVANAPEKEPERVGPVARTESAIDSNVTADGGDGVELTEEAIEIIEAAREVAANGAALGVQGEMEGSLLDVVA